MRLNKLFVLAALLVAVLSFAGCITITGDETATETPTTSASAPSTTDGAVPRLGYMAPGFELENLDGQTVSLESLRGRYVMLNFWATWCGPCRSISPIIEELAKEFGGRVKVTKLNVDENPGTPSQYGVRGIPTLILFKEGKVLDQIVGAVPKARLKALIEKAL